eukprot:TRINITY_DN34458_c0_g1_i1.p1 TRINITY_DN34458_c0_g1~~TRINITY_DN34458_c0_g1_i1.p1  ORF type:complete len:103 (+),score=4.03 TRINITY_DN34458_c0_g1_i1:48-311(+)
MWSATTAFSVAPFAQPSVELWTAPSTWWTLCPGWQSDDEPLRLMWEVLVALLLDSAGRISGGVKNLAFVFFIWWSYVVHIADLVRRS